MYFWAPCHGYALNCHFVYLAMSRIRPKMKTHLGLHNILKNLKHVKSAFSFRNLLSHFIQDKFYTRNTHWGTCMVELIKSSCQAKIGA